MLSVVALLMHLAYKLGTLDRVRGDHLLCPSRPTVFFEGPYTAITFLVVTVVNQAVQIVGYFHTGLTLDDNLLVKKLVPGRFAGVVSPPKASVAVAVPRDKLEY